MHQIDKETDEDRKVFLEMELEKEKIKNRGSMVDFNKKLDRIQENLEETKEYIRKAKERPMYKWFKENEE